MLHSGLPWPVFLVCFSGTRRPRACSSAIYPAGSIVAAHKQRRGFYCSRCLARQKSLKNIRVILQALLSPTLAYFMNADQLQCLLNDQIPLTLAMQLKVAHVDERRVQLLAPLDPNRNLHGTAFAGSLYCVATLAGWSLLSAYVAERGWHGAVVLRHGDIRYLRPVASELVAEATWADDDSLPAFLADVGRRGKGRVIIPVTIRQADKIAVSFNGEFVFSQHQEG